MQTCMGATKGSGRSTGASAAEQAVAPDGRLRRPQVNLRSLGGRSGKESER